ncbi:plasmid recombination protein [Rhizobium sp. S153]|uniref:Plasmid recombination protein n=1 Tax=Ciceribacter sichuanensis TaxID=2949647 RepID=A0ABT0VC19_9HYPH|nr:plasmid recombination protein [Ciceribacter sp. S153]MCM2403430.1 plasmid recombination protein [Ciceribacter sp. S153]
MAFQFVHMEAFSNKGDGKGRTVSFVMAEARRDPVASVHVMNPSAPLVVYGATVNEVEAMHDAAAAVALTAVKGGKPRKLRQDHKTLHTVIASHPYTMEEVRADPAKLREAEEWERRTIGWLRSQYGDDLKSVVRHEDESHFHVHAYIVPTDDPEMRALRHHPGVMAKRATMAAGPAEGEDRKALSKKADAAYKCAMRSWQDAYHEAVGIPCGLARLGPQRRRLTRDEWQAEQVQARALRTTIERAKAVKARGESMIASTKEDAAAIRAEAAAAKAEADHQIVAAKVAREQAVREQHRATAMMARLRDEAARVHATAARLQGLPGMLRSMWDGFRRSKVQERIRQAVASEMDGLRRTAAESADRASAADAGRREAESRARNLRENLSETGRQLAEVRQELAALRPESAPAAPASTF